MKNKNKQKMTEEERILFVKETYLQNLKFNIGQVQRSCEMTGVTYETIRKYRKADPEFAEKENAIRIGQIEWVESKLFELIEAGDKAAIMFYLRYKARELGYTDKIEIENKTNIIEWKEVRTYNDKQIDDIQKADEIE